MNVAFFGTSDKSTPILTVLKNCFDIKLCITKKDTLVGREQEVRETEVKKWAKLHNIDFICINSMKNDKQNIIDELKFHNIELGIVADFNFIIPEDIIRTTKFGLVNIHFSLLPALRGASPVQHAILNGLNQSGITYYLLDKGMDTGDILDQVKVDIYPTETAGELYIRLFDIAANKLTDVVNNYTQGKIQPVKQDNTKASYCYSRTNPTSTLIAKEDSLINWSDEAYIIERQVRAYDPWPIVWTYLNTLENNEKLSEHIKFKDNVNKNLRVKIYSSQIENNKLKIKKLQVEGKNIVDWESFKRGYTL